MIRLAADATETITLDVSPMAVDPMVVTQWRWYDLG
jgi:hypothetical protein